MSESFYVRIVVGDAGVGGGGDWVSIDGSNFPWIITWPQEKPDPLAAKIAKLQALADRAGSEGEREAALRAIERLRGRGH